MNTLDAFRTAVRALTANPMRTALTMLGVIIGVGSMVSMAAIGAGAQARVAEQIRAFGANVLTINPGAGSSGGVRSASGTGHTLTSGDAEAIADLSLVSAAAPSVFGTAQIVNGDKNWSTTVNGTTDDHFVIRDWALSGGRFFSPEEEAGAGKVALIGAIVADKLFGKVDPIGSTIRILNTPFTVIGVLSEKGSVGSGPSQDDVVFVPLLTARLRLIGSANVVNRNTVAYILAKAVASDLMASASEQIRLLLQQRHKIEENQDDDFVVSNAAAMLASQKASTRTVSILLGSIAAVSLIVGGISIMNIMLVSVTERTPEIGLRLAIGARPRDIRNQFLLESVTLCLLGGFVGLGIGAGAAWLVATLVGWPILLEPDTASFALLFAGCVGTFFGYYPANQAARLQPVLALKAG